MKKLKSIVAAAIFVGALGVAVPSNLRAQAPWDCYFDGQCEYIAACWGGWAMSFPCTVDCYVETECEPPILGPCWQLGPTATCGLFVGG
jgi:hypothetical protein